MNQSPEELRAKYLQNPPDGMTRENILHMSTDALLDMDYFLNEDVFGEDSFGEEGFYIFLNPSPAISILYLIKLYN